MPSRSVYIYSGNLFSYTENGEGTVVETTLEFWKLTIRTRSAVAKNEAERGISMGWLVVVGSGAYFQFV